MKVIDIINRAKSEGKTRFTIEMLPPLKGEGTEGVFAAIDNLVKYNPAYINITNHREISLPITLPNGLTGNRLYRHRPGTVGISAAIERRYGTIVVPHVICGGKSRYDIEDDLIDLDFLGIRNVLALRGDTIGGESCFAPHPLGYTHASELVYNIAQMNRGNIIDATKTGQYNTDFCIGVAGYPEKHVEAVSAEQDLEYLKGKVAAGADYIVTQMSFDTATILTFIERCRKVGIEVPIVAGIKPLTTIAQIDILPKTFNVTLPDELLIEAKKCRNDESVRDLGIEWAISQSRELIRAGLPIIHFYTMSRTETIARIVKELF